MLLLMKYRVEGSYLTSSQRKLRKLDFEVCQQVIQPTLLYSLHTAVAKGRSFPRVGSASTQYISGDAPDEDQITKAIPLTVSFGMLLTSLLNPVYSVTSQEVLNQI